MRTKEPSEGPDAQSTQADLLLGTQARSFIGHTQLKRLFFMQLENF